MNEVSEHNNSEDKAIMNADDAKMMNSSIDSGCGDIQNIKNVIFEMNTNLNKFLNGLNNGSNSNAKTNSYATKHKSNNVEKATSNGSFMPKCISLSELFSTKLSGQSAASNSALKANNNGASKVNLGFNTTTKAYLRSENVELPERVYIKRNSLLTEMFKISDIRTIRHIFISIMTVLALHVMFNDLMEKGTIDFDFELIRWCFDKFPIVFYTWLYMTFSTVFIVYYCFHYWSHSRIEYLANRLKHLSSDSTGKKQSGKSSVKTKQQSNFLYYDMIWLLAFIVYMILFLVIPATVVIKNRLPTASAFIVLMEQIRMVMKTYAFVRSNVPRAMENAYYKLQAPDIMSTSGLTSTSESNLSEIESELSKTASVTNHSPKSLLKSLPRIDETRSAKFNLNSDDDDEDDEEDELGDESDDKDRQMRSMIPLAKLCPNFSKYLYFLFAPTLVYRDNYPRTKRVKWDRVFFYFAQVIGAILYIYYIFERFCIPVFRNFNTEHVTLKMFVQSILNCTLPGVLVQLVAFYSFLHCWLNAFAEMLRFGDRMFYKDWWNSDNFSNYYRTWNVVVHDWLYTYIYRDLYYLFGKKYRFTCQFVIFFISALFHEYILTLAFGFFYPVLFLMFGAIGFFCIFLKFKNNQDFMNFTMWLGLCIGLGGLMCLYSIEWYARQNCPKSFKLVEISNIRDDSL